MTTAAAEFSDLMRRIARPEGAGELVAHGVNRAARRLGISRRTARAYWYGERKQIPAPLMDKARALAGEAKHELSELDARIARLEALLLHLADERRAAADAVRAVGGGPDSAVG